jgi:hypothetical protein
MDGESFARRKGERQKSNHTEPFKWCGGFSAPRWRVEVDQLQRRVTERLLDDAQIGFVAEEQRRDGVA